MTSTITTDRSTFRIGYNQLVELISLISIILWSFLLAGCTASNSIRNIYILALSYNKSPSPISDPLQITTNTTKVLQNQVLESLNIIQEVRIGYISMCVAFDSGAWSCSTNSRELATSVRDKGNGDPLNLLSLGNVVRTRTLFYGLFIISLVFAFLSILFLLAAPRLRKRIQGPDTGETTPVPTRKIAYIALVLNLVATLLGFASAFWQHISATDSSTIVRSLTYNLVAARVGTGSIVLGWVAASVSAIVTLGLLMIVLSIHILERLEQ
ncbi:hypothetical protein O1611_g3736 [Lasiodiplodia mahajangana]|uniref:Uncharacterized protein n=1 Tax=Lasiodiplodia mahajangana TaxID=1108764 RepID=A0ACC2JQW5_9PEZI|nr:hypothetical protein O1611_g3736 [Lasiodiplodia mahajangana]